MGTTLISLEEARHELEEALLDYEAAIPDQRDHEESGAGVREPGKNEAQEHFQTGAGQVKPGSEGGADNRQHDDFEG